MAQMTETLALEALAHCHAGISPPLTGWEMQQLIHGWLESQTLRKDAERLRWIERVIKEKAAVWLLPCGPDLRFVQVRHMGDCENYPTVEGLRAAIDAAMQASDFGAA